MIRQGEIYLVNFGKKYNSELGKIRPAVIVQNDFFNKTVEKKLYRQVLVVPLSTVAIEDDYRLKIKPRDRLEKESYMVANWICTLDFNHLLLDKGVIAKLDRDELNELKKRICNIME
jgi:mRNA interferase MazF